MRILTLETDTDIETVGKSLLNTRLGGEQAAAALDRLKAFNPHLGRKKLRAGTIVFVPDHPGFKEASGALTKEGTFEAVRKLAASALDDAAKTFKSGGARRAGEREEVQKALKSAAVKRAAETDKEIADQAQEAAKTLAEDEAEDKRAQEAFFSMREAALSALAEAGKRFS